MELKTRYKQGDKVIVELDGGFNKATVTTVQVYIPEEYAQTMQPIIRYGLIAQAYSPMQHSSEYTTYERPCSSTEEELDYLYKLYIECDKAIEATDIPQQQREKQILWDMRRLRDEKAKQSRSKP